MRIFRRIEEFVPPEKGIALALGRFDGVHPAHRALIGRTVELAHQYHISPSCFSFYNSETPDPECPGWLTTSIEKAALISEIGIENLLYPDFDRPIIDLSPHEFLETLVIERWKARIIVAGYDYRFGKNRSGDPDLLKTISESHGVIPVIFEPVLIDSVPVKATAIREMISKGDVEQAIRLLGRPYSITGRIVEGRKLGKKMGFPTLNFRWPVSKVVPKFGVYAVRIGSEFFNENKSSFNAVASFGVSPTIDSSNRIMGLEVHVLDEIGVLISGKPIPSDTDFKIEFISFIRPEEKFDSIEELTRQISIDCDSARAMFKIIQ
ncbi:MAG: riboflavin biosynthesis protein RibF [bacterium]